MKTEEIIKSIETEISGLSKRLDQLKDSLSPKTEFEVGKYVYIINATSGACGCEGSIGKITTAPKQAQSGCLLEDSDLFIQLLNGMIWSMRKESSDLRYLTESEVKEALEKEAVKKYNGKSFKCLFNNDRYGSKKFECVFDYTSDIKEGIYSENGWCYINGKWAEPIVKEEAIKIGGYEVKFVHVSTFIDGHEFTKEFWESALKISEHSKAGVWVGCGAKSLDSSSKWYASPEQIKSILEKLK